MNARNQTWCTTVVLVELRLHCGIVMATLRLQEPFLNCPVAEASILKYVELELNVNNELEMVFIHPKNNTDIHTYDLPFMSLKSSCL